MLKPFTYAIGTFIGIGVLVLPFLFQEVGVILATFGLLAAAFLLLLLGFIVFDLVGKTKKDLPSSVEEFLTWSKPLVRVSLAVFTYGALVAYVMGAGQQLFALFGGQIQYWGTLFFVLAAWPVIQNSHIFDRVAIYLSLALLFVIALLVPFNMAALNVSVPAFGSWAAFPFLLSVSIFALFGHPSIYEITKMRKKESEARYNFFGAFFVALLVYLAYAITSVSVGPMSDLSTVSLLFYHSSGIGYVISLVAILAFYTSFVNISEAFMNSIKKATGINSGSALSLLFFPTAVLYILIRQYGIMSLMELVARFCGVGILIFSVMACVAHFRMAKKTKTTLPGWLSAVLAFIFAGITAFNILPL